MNKILGTVLVLTLSACSSSTDEPGSPTGPSSSGPIHYAAIGASDGIGFGSSSPCLPFTECPDGRGYVQILRRDFIATGRPFQFRPLYLPGAVLSRTIEDLARDIGRPIDSLAGNFIERQAPFVPTDATHVTIFAGGNDANVIAQAARAGRGGSDVNAYVDAQVRQWGTDLTELITRVRGRAPNARIVLLNLPNLGAAPYVSGNTVAERSLMQRVAVGLADQANARTAQGVLIADLMCDARLYDPSYYASDGFHPGDRGYSVFADLVRPQLIESANLIPNPSCPQRRLLP